MADACMEDLSTDLEAVRSLYEFVRRRFPRAAFFGSSLPFIRSLVCLLDDVLVDVLARIGPELLQATAGRPTPPEIRDFVDRIGEVVIRTREMVDNTMKLCGANVLFRLWVRMLLVPHMNRAQTHYEDIHAFTASYLNESGATKAIPWSDFARRAG